MTELSFTSEAIGVIHTPYGQKFAVPRQPGLAHDVRCTIELFEPYCDPQACIGLQGFSHIHVIFVFDQVTLPEKFRPMIRPPRLGGNQRVGVFASRSPFRPNRLGLSVVKLEKVENVHGRTVLTVLGADMVDGTPVLDIKPYIPFVDAIADAKGGFATEPPPLKEVVLSPLAQEKIKRFHVEQKVIEEILAQDPRPAYKGQGIDDRIYHALLLGYNFAFTVRENVISVIDIEEKDATATTEE